MLDLSLISSVVELNLDQSGMTEEVAMMTFYKWIAFTMQGVCRKV